MDIQKRLLRRPLTTALWGVVLVVMSLMLCVGCAMMYSSGSLAGILDQYHTSIAVSTDQSEHEEEWEGMTVIVGEDMKLFQEDIDYLSSLDSVEEVYFQTLTGGYCPDFIPALATERDSLDNETYYNVMVAGRVDKILLMEEHENYYDLESVGLSAEDPEANVYLEISVEEIVLANESYLQADDTKLNLICTSIGQEAIDYIQEGERYMFFAECDPTTFYYADVPGMQGFKKILMRHPTVYRDGQIDKLTYDDINLHTYLVFGDPFMKKLDGTVEEFLADPENAEWVQVAESWEKLQHSLPVIGTDAIETMYAFVDKRATLAEGRFFIQEEYDSGARVCMLSQSLAKRSGIEVGDTISLSQFLCGNTAFDVMRNDSNLAGDGMLNNPTCGAYVSDLEFETVNEEFTVVGLYRLSNEWENSSYSFTPNTVFIPRLAQAEGAFGGMSRVEAGEYIDQNGETQVYSSNYDGGTFGIYLTLKLKNAKVSEFKTAIAESDYAGRFITLDQGYEKILVGLNAVASSSLRLFLMVAVGWVLLAALYLLLFQGPQRRNLGIMRSQGATPGQARKYLFGSGMIPAALGIVLGAAASMAVLDTVQKSLVTSAFGQAVMEGGTVLSQEILDSMIVQSQLPRWMLVVAAAAQILLFGAVLWLHAAVTAKRPPRKLLSK